jgi:hypothetical protein
MAYKDGRLYKAGISRPLVPMGEGATIQPTYTESLKIREEEERELGTR